MSNQKKGSTRFRGYENPQVQERFDYAELVRRQIDRCLLVSIDEEAFENAVNALEALIPADLQDEEYKEERDKATVTIEVFDYVYSGPLKLGSEKEPLMKKKPFSENRYPIPYITDEDGKKVIDWDDPNIISPYKIETEQTDINLRFQAAFNQFCRLGLAVRRVTRG